MQLEKTWVHHTYKSWKKSGEHPEKNLGRCYPKKNLRWQPYKNLDRFYRVQIKQVIMQLFRADATIISLPMKTYSLDGQCCPSLAIDLALMTVKAVSLNRNMYERSIALIIF